jgi:hypothetical protein
LVSAIQKINGYNDWLDRSVGATPQAGAAATYYRYVPLAEQLEFTRAVAIRWADWPATVSAGMGAEGISRVVR